MATIIPIQGAFEIIPPPASYASAAARINAGIANRVNRPDGSVWWVGRGGPGARDHQFNLQAARIARTQYGEDPAVYFGPILVMSSDEINDFDNPKQEV